MDTIPTVEIPEDIRDNSETVTDYAFMRHRSPGRGRVTTVGRDRKIDLVHQFPRLRYTHYGWTDVNPDGQRARFDMITNNAGQVVYLFHTEYFTRVPCAIANTWIGCHSYADRFVTVTRDGQASRPEPYCDWHAEAERREHGPAYAESEPLRIGQHD